MKAYKQERSKGKRAESFIKREYLVQKNKTKDHQSYVCLALHGTVVPQWELLYPVGPEKRPEISLGYTNSSGTGGVMEPVVQLMKVWPGTEGKKITTENDVTCRSNSIPRLLIKVKNGGGNPHPPPIRMLPPTAFKPTVTPQEWHN